MHLPRVSRTDIFPPLASLGLRSLAMAPAPSTSAEQAELSTRLIVTIVVVPGEWSFFPFSFASPRSLIPSVPHPVIVITAVILLWLCVIREKGWLCTARPVSGSPSPATSRGAPIRRGGVIHATASTTPSKKTKRAESIRKVSQDDYVPAYSLEGVQTPPPPYPPTADHVRCPSYAVEHAPFSTDTPVLPPSVYTSRAPRSAYFTGPHGGRIHPVAGGRRGSASSTGSPF